MNEVYSRLELIARLNSEFGHVSLGIGTTLAEAESMDSYCYDAVELARLRCEDKVEREDWRLVDEEYLLRILHVFLFVNREGKAYYVPAVLNKLVLGSERELELVVGLSLGLVNQLQDYLILSTPQCELIRDVLQFTRSRVQVDWPIADALEYLSECIQAGNGE